MAETRITGGAWRGRVIATPRGLRVRPTRSMVRESVFNILGQRLDGWTVVDLYAGAGTLGFEALSRGAATAHFVDRHPASLELIAATAARFGCRERVTAVRSDALAWLRGAGGRVAAAADAVFLDAPYRDDEVAAVVARLGEVAPARVVCEHHAARELPAHPGRMIRHRVNRYGLTAVSFYGREGEPE